ncbi:MAG: mevalonate kinase [Anaerolineales bacterium]|nr:mevalonate kinase [Anaerolineales bacterium]
MIRACAPGKIILFGEHAVVHNRPALAVPIRDLQACALITARPTEPDGSIWINAPALSQRAPFDSLPQTDPLAQTCRLTLAELQIENFPAFEITIDSTIPLASGMGSGAAVSVAIIRAISCYLNNPLTDKAVNDITYEIEKIHHGTPSGVDNTVITFNQPVFFIRGKTMETFSIKQAFTLLIADSGIQSPTAAAVAFVRHGWQQDPERFEYLFDSIGAVAASARTALSRGEINALGPLMDKNQALLAALGVSAPENEHLIQAAKKAGAPGAKLSGGGLGGNVIVLAPEKLVEKLETALLRAGAAACYRTEISS